MANLTESTQDAVHSPGPPPVSPGERGDGGRPAGDRMGEGDILEPAESIQPQFSSPPLPPPRMCRPSAVSGFERKYFLWKQTLRIRKLLKTGIQTKLNTNLSCFQVRLRKYLRLLSL